MTRQEINYMLLRIRDSRKFGRLLEAERMCVELLRKSPACLRARAQLASIGRTRWAARAAERQLAAIIDQDPASANALSLLAEAQAKQERHGDASQSALRALEIQPDDRVAQYRLSFCLVKLERYEEAEPWLVSLVDAEPDNPVFHDLHGLALLGAGHHQKAVEAFQTSARLAPDSITSRIYLATTLLTNQDASGAADWSRSIISLVPKNPLGFELLSQALLLDNFEDEAEQIARQAVDLCPYESRVYARLGFVLQARGRMEAADAASLRSLELEQVQGFAYSNLMRGRRLTPDDRELIDKASMATQSDRLDITERSALGYALGKAFEDLGDYEKAIAHYDLGNELAYQTKFGRAVYSDEQLFAIFPRQRETFTAALIRQNQGKGLDTDLPIFVVGMPRSGTTLAEQILSCHPDVAGAGELGFWPENGQKPVVDDGMVNKEALRELAENYCGHLERIGPGKRHVVDKMPGNFLHLGMVHLAFPRAKVIHTRRHPIDTCLSIYVTENRARIAWAHQNSTIGRYYERYLALMDYWREVLPGMEIYDVEYEKLVSDPDQEIRNLIAFCGLEWSDACLRPQENPKIVVTPSVWQVRQPIYRSSIARWMRFRPWLGELMHLLPDEDQDSSMLADQA